MENNFKNAITICMPVYNEEKYIAETIESIVNQACRIIITDNASTDKTGDICKKYIQNYPNIEYIRHDTNIGALKNFYYPLSFVNTEFFMWISGHDIVESNYTESLIGILNTCPDAVLAYAPCQSFIETNKGEFTYDYWYSYHLSSDDPFERVYSLISYLYNCFLIHGVFRTNIIKKSIHQNPCLAGDHIILTKAAKFGRFLYYPHTKIYARTIRKENWEEAKDRTIKDLVGKMDAKLQKDPYLELKQEQYKIIKSIKTKNYFKKLIYINKARKKLISMWGAF